MAHFDQILASTFKQNLMLTSDFVRKIFSFDFDAAVAVCVVVAVVAVCVVVVAGAVAVVAAVPQFPEAFLSI